MFTLQSKTVDAVIDRFKKTIDDLQFVVEHQAATARQHQEEIERLTASREAASAEAARAEQIRSKLLQIFE